MDDHTQRISSSLGASVPGRRFPSVRALAAASGLVSCLLSSSAHANQMGMAGLDSFGILVVLVGALGAVVSLVFLLVALIAGRRSAPVAPWKAKFGMAGIVIGVISAILTFVALVLGMYVGVTLASSSEKVAIFFVLLGLIGVPFGISVGSVVASVRLRRRNPPTAE